MTARYEQGSDSFELTVIDKDYGIHCSASGVRGATPPYDFGLSFSCPNLFLGGGGDEGVFVADLHRIIARGGVARFESQSPGEFSLSLARVSADAGLLLSVKARRISREYWDRPSMESCVVLELLMPGESGFRLCEDLIAELTHDP